jgi:hypothetical protein
MTAPFIGTLPHGGMEVASTPGYAIVFRTASSTRLTSSSITSEGTIGGLNHEVRLRREESSDRPPTSPGGGPGE